MPVDMRELPDFAHWINPVLRALSELGGTARPREVVDLVAKNEQVPDDALNETLPSGGPRFPNQVHWARFYLAHQGYIDRSRHGVWKLSEAGRAALPFSREAIVGLIEAVQRDTKPRPIGEPLAGEPAQLPEVQPLPVEESEEALPPEQDDVDYRLKLLRTLQSLSPGGFERLCQRLLREAGFERVVVTGKSGDGGIDGHGVLSINSFVTFRVLFQCKRYVGSVTSPQVRDFRGAMDGRADKGLILTTGSFTMDAQREATRDGASPIELVDGEKLVGLFAKLELGLTPVPSYELVDSFFDEYR